MNILFINHMGFLGGGERSMLSLMEGLRENEQYQVFLLAQPGELVQKAGEQGFKCFEYQFTGIKRTLNPFNWIAGLARLWPGVLHIERIITGNNITLVHANSLKSAIMGGMAGRRAGVPMVFHTRDFLPAGIWRKPLVAWAYNLSDKIIANSKSVAQIYGKDPGGKVSVVYNYVEPPKIQADKAPRNLRAENGCPANAPLIGYSGRLHPAKGLETLLTGFSQILKLMPEAILWIVGGTMPGEEQYLESLKITAKKMGIAGSVKLFGWRQDAMEIMSCFDVLVVPSQREPFGRVTVEAMMIGIPVVATASGGTLEIIDDNQTGLLFKPRDSRELAIKCLGILQDSKKADKMINLAKSEVKRKFSAEKYIDGVQEVYDSLAGK